MGIPLSPQKSLIRKIRVKKQEKYTGKIYDQYPLPPYELLSYNNFRFMPSVYSPH